MTPITNTLTTRFAPSPTGYLHVGGARTALFNWLLARHRKQDGRFLLRIEDTDLARSTQQACDQLLEDLRWLGLHWDNDQLVFQSQRTGVYNLIIDDLLARNLAYRAYETPEELEAMRKQVPKGQQFVYRRDRATDEQRRRHESEGRPHVVRFAMPVREWRFRDEVLGKDIVLPPEECQDFVIRKTDGMPTYHFAVVVDDAEMGVTHILRGQEHTKNTFNHIALQEALGYPRPTYGHLPIIMNMDGSKMGKRDRDKKIREYSNASAKPLWFINTDPRPEPIQFSDAMKRFMEKNKDRLLATGRLTRTLVDQRIVQVEQIFGDWMRDRARQLDVIDQFIVMEFTGLKESDLPEILVHDYRKNGYLPEALLNFLALLGWNPGGDRERMTMDELTDLFSVENIGKSNAKFNREKLIAFNTDAISSATPQRLLAAFKDYLSVNPDSPVNAATDDQLSKLLAMKKGFRTFREVDELSRFFFTPDDRLAYDHKAIDSVLRKNDNQGLTALRDVRQVLAQCPDWTAPALEAAVKAYCDQKQLGLGKVAQPIRVAVSGTTVSPPIFESLEFLGREKTLARIDRCLGTAT